MKQKRIVVLKLLLLQSIFIVQAIFAEKNKSIPFNEPTKNMISDYWYNLDGFFLKDYSLKKTIKRVENLSDITLSSTELPIILSSTTVYHPTIGNIGKLTDDNESTSDSNNRFLVGDDTSSGASIYADLGGNKTKIVLQLFGYFGFGIDRGEDLEIYVATEAEGAFPVTNYFNGSHGTLKETNVNVNTTTGTMLALSGTFRYIAIRQPNGRYLQLSEVNVYEDTTAPVITLTGAASITHTYGTTYTDAGAMVTDNLDANVSTSASGTVDVNTTGVYTIVYSATDQSGNVATEVTRTVTVKDEEAPVITLKGPAIIKIQKGQPYTDVLGVTVTDNLDTDLEANVDLTVVDTATLGTYTMTYTVTDAGGNEATAVTRSVEVIATNSKLPTVTSLRSNLTVTSTNVVEAGLGDVFKLVDENIASNQGLQRVLVGDGTTTGAAIYIDLGANKSNAKLLQLHGYMDFGVNRGEDLEIYVATETEGAFPSADYFDGSHGTLKKSDVDVSTATGKTIFLEGTFRYIAIRQPNARYLQLTEVNVYEDTTAPVITLTGASSITHTYGTSYTDAGATVTDNIEDSLSVVVGGDIVDVNTVGVYIITYNIMDDAGNVATEVTRTVTVKDEEAPVITLKGPAIIKIQKGQPYTDVLGVTVTDNLDTDLEANVDLTVVDTATLGTYTMTYTVTDAGGNEATAVTRSVEVIATNSKLPTVTSLRSNLTVTSTNVVEAGLGDVFKLVDENIASNQGLQRVLVGDGTTTGAAIYIDLGANKSNAKLLQLHGYMDFGVNRGEDLEIYVATETEGAFPSADYFDGSHGTLKKSDVDVSTATGKTIFLEGTFRYIAIRQPNARYLQLTEVNVYEDTTAPVITLTGAASITHTYGTSYTDAGATVTDNIEDSLSVVVGGDIVDVNTVGVYIITYNIMDDAGNVATEVTRTVTVKDEEAPVITLKGPAIIKIQKGQPYTDVLGVTVTDNLDTDLEANVDLTVVDTATLGTYTVTYTVTDAGGNEATAVTRSVEVIATNSKLPTVTSLRSNLTVASTNVVYPDAGGLFELTNENISSNQEFERMLVGDGTTTGAAIYIDLGANKSNAKLLQLHGYFNFGVNRGEDLEIYVATETEGAFPSADYFDGSHGTLKKSDVDVSTATGKTIFLEGTFRYIAIRQPNARYLQLTEVNVYEDTTAPVITLTGASSITHTYGTSYTDAGATVTDNIEDSLSVVVGGDTVDVNTLGVYTITYNITDDAGNVATEVTRQVEITAIAWNNTSTAAVNPNISSNWAGNVTPGPSDAVLLESTSQVTWDTDFTVGTIIIKSGASLISTADVIGDVNVIRSLTANWHLISSSVKGQDIDAFVSASNLAQGQVTNIGFAPYDNSTGTWSYYQSNASGSGNFMLGGGYSIKKASAGDIMFTGNFNADDTVTIPIVKNANNGFNLVGNPYTSYVSVKEILEESGNTALVEQQTIWLWDATEGNTGGYIEYNLAKDLEIAPGQGFFVEGKSTGSLKITEEMQSHNTDTFKKGGNSRPEINVTLASGNTQKRTRILYIDSTTKGFDNGYDSSIFEGFSNQFALYTHAVAGGSGRNLGIQALPKDAYESMIIPIGVNAVSGTDLTFSAEAFNLPDGIAVYLEDRADNTFTKLDAKTYSTTALSDLKGIGRFYLHTSSTVLTAPVETLENVSIYLSSKKTLQIEGIRKGETRLELYSVLGKKVINTTFVGNGNNHISLPELSAGIYFVEMNNEIGIFKQKLIIE